MEDDFEEEDPGSLADRVYTELKRRLNNGNLGPGDFIDQGALGRELGMSRAPLRDALIRLEVEGFVTTYPRRGVMVRPLDLAAVRDIYEILGALEGAAAEHAEGRFGLEQAEALDAHIAAMEVALESDDFNSYYAANVAFHDVYIGLSPNADLRRTVRLLKERLYDFPRRRSFLREWELASMGEHRELAARFRCGDYAGAARWIREVHWSYSVQEAWVRAYYVAGPGAAP